MSEVPLYGTPGLPWRRKKVVTLNEPSISPQGACLVGCLALPLENLYPLHQEEAGNEEESDEAAAKRAPRASECYGPPDFACQVQCIG